MSHRLEIAVMFAAAMACSRLSPLPQPAPARILGTIPTPTIPATRPTSVGGKLGNGMWPPHLLEAQIDQLRELGLELEPTQLSDPGSKVLGAVVNVGGCSASFVSPSGLIVTNHHCAIRALEHNSTPERNLLETGYLARAGAEELTSGPAARASLLLSSTDVTEEVRNAIQLAADDVSRVGAYDAVQKRLVQRCEQARSNVRCQLVYYYDGLSYALIERLEFRDLRIVYAPAAGIGNFGGEVDNWRWPRHTGDFALFRAYVGADGAPAAFASSNVPYQPKHWLRIGKHPLQPSDLVMVAGFPGHTSRWKTLEEVSHAMTWLYPRRIGMYDDYIAAFEALGERDPEAKIRAVPWARGFNNYRTKHRGELEGMQRIGLLDAKSAELTRLRARLAETASDSARYGTALDALSRAFAERAETIEADTELQTEICMPRLISAANRIVRMAEERARPDAERDPEYQDRNRTSLRDELVGLERQYHPALDVAVLTLALRRALRVPPKQRSPAVSTIAGKNPTDDSIRTAVERLYSKTKLSDPRLRLRLFESATSQQLRAHPDPMIHLAVALRPLLREAELRDKALRGKLLLHKPLYAEALLKLVSPGTAPDANGTLRIAFGTIQTESHREDGKPLRAFTTLSEVVAKDRGRPPFAVPERLLDAARQGRFGQYVDPTLADVPVDFLSNINTTNGNSGSATLNARGELVGLLFDGTYESVASDWIPLPNTRSIHVDIRYLLWLLSEVERADPLMQELEGAQQATSHNRTP